MFIDTEYGKIRLIRNKSKPKALSEFLVYDSGYPIGFVMKVGGKWSFKHKKGTITLKHFSTRGKAVQFLLEIDAAYTVAEIAEEEDGGRAKEAA